jgi:hypothetical protein
MEGIEREEWNQERTAYFCRDSDRWDSFQKTGDFRMRLRVISLIGMLALTAVIAFGHGDKKHVMGTLEKINADSVVVK